MSCILFVDLVCLSVNGNMIMFIITVRTTIEKPYELVKSKEYESKNPIARANGSNIANFYQISCKLDYK